MELRQDRCSRLVPQLNCLCKIKFAGAVVKRKSNWWHRNDNVYILLLGWLKDCIPRPPSPTVLQHLRQFVRLCEVWGHLRWQTVAVWRTGCHRGSPAMGRTAQCKSSMTAQRHLESPAAH